jgi:ABC-type microcin C transport system duplicated ATPase subunit YejF
MDDAGHLLRDLPEPPGRLTLLDEARRTQGIAYLFFSHDLAFVRSVTERIVVLRHGKVVEQGATEAVLSDQIRRFRRELEGAQT